MTYRPGNTPLRRLVACSARAGALLLLPALVACSNSADDTDTGGDQNATAAPTISAAGTALATLLNGMPVLTAWQPVVAPNLQLVNWETGLVSGNVSPQPNCTLASEAAPAGDTFCSSFVSAVALEAGSTLAGAPIPFLHPYNSKTTTFGSNGQCAPRDFLSDYQQQWLQGVTLSPPLPSSWGYTPPKNTGWKPVPQNSMVDAQTLANAGNLVVASYRYPSTPYKPGHITVVRPGVETATTIAAQGPDVITAGETNSVNTSLKNAFIVHSCNNNKNPSYCGNGTDGTPIGAWESMSSTNPKILFFYYPL